MKAARLDEELCYRAASGRDARFDGRFFIGVRTTGIYCRPICPVRTPRRENMQFYPSAAAAEAAGFRACKRCRPDVAPASAAWHGTSATVSRALTLIDAGALDQEGIDGLAGRLGIGARHLRRLFLQHLGAPPTAIAHTRRMHYARLLLEQSSLPIHEIAWASGFHSLRRFNACIRDSFGRAPRELRKTRGNERRIELRLAYRAPLDWSRMLAWLRARADAGIETVTVDAFEREGTHVRNDHARGVVVVSLPTAESWRLRSIVARVRRLFDLDADPNVIEAHLAKDPLLARLIRRAHGIRVPGAWDPLDLAVRVIAQKRRDGTAARALAEAVSRGTLVLCRAATLEDSIAMLRAVPGVGPSTAQHIAMHALGEPDAFPAGDPILRRRAGNLTARELLRRAEAWRPWRAYAAMLLWSRA